MKRDDDENKVATAKLEKRQSPQTIFPNSTGQTEK